MGSWGCPHEINGVCQRVKKLPCDPGMKGCVLYGRVVFSNPTKNRRSKPAPEALQKRIASHAVHDREGEK